MSASSDDPRDDLRSNRQRTPGLGDLWWLPSAFVVLALLSLFITPLVVERRVAELRTRLTYGSEHARVLLNDLEASFTSELLLRQHTLEPSDTTALASLDHLRADERELAETIREMGPDATTQFEQLSTLLRRWNDAARGGGPLSAKDGIAVLTKAEELDALFAATSDRQRDEVRRVERLIIVMPAVLAPVALVAMVLVLWSGGRTRRFARAAERERLEVVRASEARAALLRGVTHDVKNPLGAAAGYAQLLEEEIVGPLMPPQREMVERIRRLVQRSVQTVTDLLELARADGELHLEYTHTDLATIVRQLIDDHRAMIQERGQTVVNAVSATPVVTDPLRVAQILANLLSNAIKYTPPGGLIQVTIEHDAKRVGVSVRDNGPGIPAALEGRVFEEFFRVRSSENAAPSGNGLGLAISRRIARLLGGDVTFATGPSGGATFTLWLDEPRPERLHRVTARSA